MKPPAQKINSEADISSNVNFNYFANEMPFVGDILQPFQFYSIFTVAEIKA